MLREPRRTSDIATLESVSDAIVIASIALASPVCC
jgi:hypothetical protein